MHILIACDSFKDALSAQEVCRAIARGLKHARPGLDVTEMPLSDGGEGVLAILRRTLSLNPVTRTVAEVGSGLDGRRAKLLRTPAIATIVVEHRDRLCRFGFENLDLTSFCSRLYGQRSANSWAARALEAMKA